MSAGRLVTVAVTAVTSLLGITATILFQTMGLITLLAIWLAVWAAIATAVAIEQATTMRTTGRSKVAKTYRVDTGDGLVYKVCMKVRSENGEPWADPKGPFCEQDLSRMVLRSDEREPHPFSEAASLYWICPSCASEVEAVAGLDDIVRGVAYGKWNRGDPSDWYS